jgi:hypothetical protein
MKGLSRKKFIPSRHEKFLAASHTTFPKRLNANQHSPWMTVFVFAFV